MTETRLILSLLCPLLLLPTAASAQANFDACSLITGAEIEAVQGEPVTGTKGSAPQRPFLAVSQCFYTLETFSRSVSLEVARRDPRIPAEDGPRAQWKRLFHPAGSKEDEPPGTPEREKESSSPLPVNGVGEEAFWIGNAITGGLYVLKNDAYIRISLGGPTEIPVKIEKARTLARKALARLAILARKVDCSWQRKERRTLQPSKVRRLEHHLAQIATLSGKTHSRLHGFNDGLLA